MIIKSSVLIVEDVEEMRLMMEQFIGAMAHFKVSGTASNVPEARLELTRRRPALVLLDEILPGESSIDFLQELVGDGIAVVLMTGVENPSHPIPRGARARVIKPDWKNLEAARSGVEAQLMEALKSR
jgi:response regulator of citrate/malate metabolism